MYRLDYCLKHINNVQIAELDEIYLIAQESYYRFIENNDSKVIKDFAEYLNRLKSNNVYILEGENKKAPTIDKINEIIVKLGIDEYYKFSI